MSDEKDALSRLRAKRNTYSFIQRKRFSSTKHFSIKKKASNPIAMLMEMFSKSTPKPGKGSKKKSQIKDSSTVSLATNKIVLGGIAAFLVLIVIFVLFALLIAGASGGSAPPAPPTLFGGNFEAQIYRAGSLTYGSSGDGLSQAYFILDFLGDGIKNVSVRANIYPQPPSNQIFILQYHRDGADTYFEFRRKFDEELSKKGWQILEVRLDDLRSLPGGCTLIIPTGYLPQSLLGSTDGSYPSITDLAARGVSVVYIGQAFDSQVMKPNGDLVSTDKSLFSKMGITFDKNSRAQSTDGLRLQSPFYVAKNDRGQASLIWGSISVINRPTGYLLLLPETLDGGWVGDGSAAAEDIARLITSEPYRHSFASLSFNKTMKNGSIFRTTKFFEPTIDDFGYLRTNFELYDENDNKREYFIDWPLLPEAYGKLYVDNPILTPSYLGGGRKTVVVDLNEPQAGEEKLYFELSKNGTSVQRISVEQGKTNLQITRSAPLQFSQDPGDYILRVVDATGKVYAATHIKMAGLDISFENELGRPSYSFKEGVFNATFYSDGKRIKVPSVTVYIDGQPKAKKVEFSNSDTISYSPQIEFKRGTYTFVFDFAGRYTTKKDIDYFLAVNVWERPEVILLAIVGVVVFAAGFYLRRPEKEKYALDIPDFPPQSSKKIPLSPQKIISVFEQVNKSYHWDMMPLSLEELKTGFRKVLIEGRPLVVGDYNLERILQKLEQRQITATSIGYWTLKSWEEKSGFSTKLICSYRFMRDTFVNNAIRFSKLRAVNGCDVKALIGRSEYYFNIYLGDEDSIAKSLKTANVSHTWLLFENSYELENFKQKLSSSSSYLVLKMNVESKRIRLFTLEEFANVLKTLKSRYS